MRYAIAICSLFDSENVVKVFEADSARDALVLALEFDFDEVEGMDIEDLIQYAFDGDMSVSKPVPIGD